MVHVGAGLEQPEVRWGDILPPIKAHSLPRAGKPKATRSIWETSGRQAVCQPLATKTSAASCRSRGMQNAGGS